MTKDSDVSQTHISRLLFGNSVDVAEYDAFLENWQKLADDAATKGVSGDEAGEKLHELEALSSAALSRLVVRQDDDAGYSASPLFGTLQSSVLICNQSGFVMSANDFATREFGLLTDGHLNQLGLSFESGGDIFPEIFIMNARATADLELVQCVDRDDKPLNLLVLALPDSKAEPQFLIVFMSLSWGLEAQGLLASRFGLSQTETDILSAFAQGVPLKQIAVDRGRSYATVRNQFQAALEKTGCPSQVDLLRLLLGASYLFTQIQSLGAAPAKSQNNVIKMMRPGRRFLEVQLFGDLNGTPFICLPSVFGMPVTADIEVLLKQQGLLMIGVFRPGFGQTSPPRSGQDLYTCLAEDIGAVLDSMEIEECPFLGRASAARPMFNLAALIPERMSRGVIVNAVVPRDYVERENVTSKWTASLMSAARMAPAVATVILGGGYRLMHRMGTRRFMSRLYGASASDRAVIDSIGVAESIADGVEQVTRQGLRAGAQDMIEGFETWADEVGRVSLPFMVVHGTEDPQVPVNAVRSFVGDFSKHLSLTEIADGGGLLNYSHTKEILALVSNGWLIARLSQTGDEGELARQRDTGNLEPIFSTPGS